MITLVCRLGIRQDVKSSTGYGYPKTAFKLEPDPDKDLRSELLYSIFWGFRRSNKFSSLLKPLEENCTLRNHLVIILVIIFSDLFAMPRSLSMQIHFWLVFGYGYDFNQNRIRIGYGYHFLKTGIGSDSKKTVSDHLCRGSSRFERATSRFAHLRKYYDAMCVSMCRLGGATEANPSTKQYKLTGTWREASSGVQIQ